MNQPQEGVIKFNPDHRDMPALPATATAALRAWFPILHQTGLLGQDKERYQGYAWGNISLRHPLGFIISCTQTSGKPALSESDFALVKNFDITANSLTSQGPGSPSSEALTHAAVYQSRPETGAVFHAHAPDIWQQAEKLGLAMTDSRIEYGTPEMAIAIGELARYSTGNGVFCMGGHEDGIIAFADNAETAGLLLIKMLVRSRL
jgi:ribulose-5-phosphate 4-epimerase/fuculose-1-phosphate aldolase